MKRNRFFAIITLFLLPIQEVLATPNLRPYTPLTPSGLYAEEIGTVDDLKIQEGCAKPDLSDSDVDGKASFIISFSNNAEPLDLTFLSSNGTPADNQKIKAALLKCKYSNYPVNIPEGSQRTFSYSWRARTELKNIFQCFFYHNSNYPSQSLRLGEQGTTTLAYRYTGSGNQYELKIAQSSGYESLDNAALKSAPIKCLENGNVERNQDPNKWIEYKINWRIPDIEAPAK